MNQICQNCKKDFLIDEDNQDFCNKIKVPYPTWCPFCRMTRRLSFVNAWSIYFRNCDKCGKQTMSAYRPDQKLIVYCQPCYWSDAWDGTEYGVDYNPAKPFLEQWKELELSTPHCALETTYLNLKNSEYCNGVAYLKNCYLTFWADYCDDTYHSSILNTIKDSSDILRAYKSELSYESVGIGNCSKTFYSDTCDDCVDVWFSRNCYGCMNCIGCVNLRGESYSIFNQKYSREDYFELVSQMKLDTREGIEMMREKCEEFTNSKPYREYAGSAQNFNVTGEYVFESKNTKDSYMCVNTEDSRFCQFITVASGKDCYDYSGWGNGANLMYECANVGENVASSKFSYYCFPDILNVEYSAWCISGKNNFGCVNLKRKSYAILNKVYDKETYENLVEKIKEDMVKNPYTDSNGRVYAYGEFFPPEFSSFPYNDSNAIKFIPKTREQAISEGYDWRDKIENNYTTTMTEENLPIRISETTDSIIQEIIECKECKKAYKIASGEYTILKKLNMPVPSSCPKCREARRFLKINKPILIHTTCAKCNQSIQTSHDTKERIVYCVKCYQQEFV